MAELSKIVVHHLDGQILKGTTQDFFPNRASFHMTPRGGGESVPVRCNKLKGVFFVRDYEGDHKREDILGFVAGPAETSHGKKIAVLFKDGELICGYALSFTRERDGFFMFPADKTGNNIRIYVLAAATKQVKAGPGADILARQVLESRAA